MKPYMITAAFLMLLFGQVALASSSVSLDRTAYPIDFAIYSLDYGKYQYHIPYKITGASVGEIELDCKHTDLLVQLNNSTEGSLTVAIPRKMLDATFNGNDVGYIVFADSKEISFDEESNLESRMLNMTFAKGVKKIEIISTQLISKTTQEVLCGMADAEESPFYSLLPPLQQISNQVPKDEVQCKQGLVLTTKSHDDSPACVRPETRQRLIEIGWAQNTVAANPDLGYEIIHGKDTFHVGEQITFQVKTRQIQNGCTSPEYKIVEKDSGKTVWDVPSVVYPCPFSSEPQKIIESIITFPNESVKTPIINKTGDYTILIIDGENSSSLDFTVLDETTDIDGHPFYYYTINDTMNSIRGEGKKITFHDVEFTLSPKPVTMNLGGFCGSGSFGASIQFSDGIKEMLRMNIPEPECADRFTKDDLIKLTNHTDPQAGLTFSDGKVRLFVSSDSAIPENAVLKVSADSPCSWMSLYNYPHSELINRHDRTGRNALMIQASDENVDDVALLKKMLGAIQETYGFEPAEHEDNTWVKHIEATPQGQQKIWDWLKETSNAQFGTTEDSSFTSYFEYDEKHYQIVWAVC